MLITVGVIVLIVAVLITIILFYMKRDSWDKGLTVILIGGICTAALMAIVILSFSYDGEHGEQCSKCNPANNKIVITN